jgi:pimeloyl-ACP methyl ester carboxylesterase
MAKQVTDLKHQYTKLPEVTLHYVMAGEGDTVVLLHGWPQTWYMWRYIIPLLAQRYQVVAPDLRGLGDSTRPLSGYDKRTVANDIWLLLRDHLSIDRILLVGHDWGGPTAFALAIAHPEVVRRMVLLDVPIPGDGTDVYSVGRWHHAFHWIHDLPETLTQDRERIYLEYFYRHWGAHPDILSDADISEYLRTYSQPGAMRAGFNYYRGYHQDVIDNQEALAHGKLKMPVLALSGSKGRSRGGNVVLESARRVAENVRGGEIVDCGHWIPEEKPEELVQELLAFFTED